MKDQEKIDPILFARKVDIDFENIKLEPHTKLRFCKPRLNIDNYKSKCDSRYLENDSRYITPEDKLKFQKEYDESLKIKNDRFNMIYLDITPINHEYFPEEFYNYYSEHENDNESFYDEDDSESDNDLYEEEYEFRSVKK